MAVLLTLALPLASSTADAKGEPLLYLRCFAINMNQGRSGTIDIAIERWSAPGEAAALKAVLMEQGREKLLSALQKITPRAGFVSNPMSLSWDIHFARQADLPDGGKKVVIVTDRPMSFWELRQDARATDYEFTLAEIRLDEKGGLEGEGKLVNAAKITYDEETKTVEIENYADEPVRLSQVAVVEPKAKKDKKE